MGMKALGRPNCRERDYNRLLEKRPDLHYLIAIYFEEWFDTKYAGHSYIKIADQVHTVPVIKSTFTDWSLYSGQHNLFGIIFAQYT